MLITYQINYNHKPTLPVTFHQRLSTCKTRHKLTNTCCNNLPAWTLLCFAIIILPVLIFKSEIIKHNLVPSILWALFHSLPKQEHTQAKILQALLSPLLQSRGGARINKKFPVVLFKNIFSEQRYLGLLCVKPRDMNLALQTSVQRRQQPAHFWKRSPGSACTAASERCTPSSTARGSISGCDGCCLTSCEQSVSVWSEEGNVEETEEGYRTGGWCLK